MQADFVHRPALPAHIGRHLQNIPDQDQDPLYDHFVVLQPLVLVLLQQRTQRLGQDFPKSGVNEGRFVALSLSLDLKEVVPRHLVLWQFFLGQEEYADNS